VSIFALLIEGPRSLLMPRSCTPTDNRCRSAAPIATDPLPRLPSGDRRILLCSVSHPVSARRRARVRAAAIIGAPEARNAAFDPALIRTFSPDGTILAMTSTTITSPDLD